MIAGSCEIVLHVAIKVARSAFAAMLENCFNREGEVYSPKIRIFSLPGQGGVTVPLPDVCVFPLSALSIDQCRFSSAFAFDQGDRSARLALRPSARNPRGTDRRAVGGLALQFSGVAPVEAVQRICTRLSAPISASRAGLHFEPK